MRSANAKRRDRRPFSTCTCICSEPYYMYDINIPLHTEQHINMLVNGTRGGEGNMSLLSNANKFWNDLTT